MKKPAVFGNGSCLLLDNKAENYTKTIYVEEHEEGEAMASYSGRRFYIRDKLFLTTVDIISK